MNHIVELCTVTTLAGDALLQLCFIDDSEVTWLRDVTMKMHVKE